jgi:RNA polymerase sigma factor (sigma-70 family)
VKDKAVINWDTLYKKEAPKLIGVCRRYVGNISAAEDIVQDSFLSAIEKADQFKGKGSIEAWIYKIVVNSTLQYLNSNKTGKIPIDKTFDLADQGANNEDAWSTRKTIENADFSQEDLLAALDYLPEHHRIVFNLYVMEGYKHKNIAKILDISIGTSKSHLARARKKIVQILLIKAEQKKKRRRAVIIWLFPESGSYIDRLYRKKFRDFEIPPKETFVAKGIKMPYKNSFSLFKAPLFYIGTAGVIALSLFFANDIIQTPPSPAEPEFIKDSIEEIYPVRKINETVPMDTEAKVLKDSAAENKPDTIRKTIRKPVYIKKTIVVRDTIR